MANNDYAQNTDDDAHFAGAKTRYNLRVVETLVAARVLSRVLSLSIPPSSDNNTHKGTFTLREVLSAYLGVQETKGQKSPALSADEVQKGLEGLVREVGRLKAKVLRGEEEYKGEEQGKMDDEDFEDEGVTLEEMVKFSGRSEDEFKEIYLSWVDGAYNLPCSQLPANISTDNFTPPLL